MTKSTTDERERERERERDREREREREKKKIKIHLCGVAPYLVVSVLWLHYLDQLKRNMKNKLKKHNVSKCD